MSLHWQPVGPLPAETYWKRRAGVLAAAVLVLVLLVWAWPSGGDDDVLEPAASPTTSAAPDPSTAPGADPSADPSATPTAAGPAPCDDGALEVTARTDAGSYAVGGRAVLTLVVKNTGAVPCSRALGQGAVELVVTSGNDRIWSSDDCAPGGDPGDTVLAPGAEETARATWDGARSAPGCPEGLPAAQPGTYRVTARVGELRAQGASFQLTG